MIIQESGFGYSVIPLYNEIWNVYIEYKRGKWKVIFIRNEKNINPVITKYEYYGIIDDYGMLVSDEI